MVIVAFDDSFKKIFSKIRDSSLKERVLKQIEKIRNTPDIGKPMRYSRKNTREIYVPPFRLSYLYIPDESKVLILDVYHKDEQ